MCGIAGWISTRPVLPAVLGRMGERLAHRGPDGAGIWISEDGCAGLVHRRLAILDPTEAGAQPMRRPGSVGVIVHNGEVYNHLSLRRDLRESGCEFTGHSDTETLLHLLRTGGERAVPSWEGMFATAFWDENRRRLILARDRLGIKPLYYAQKGTDFFFASEPKALLEVPALSRMMDLEAAADFVSYGYVPFDRSIFSGIQKLPPAHTLIWEDGRAEIRSYWSLKDRSPSGPDAIRLRELLEAAVESHRLADVPVGSFLSGGVDSGSVTAILAGKSKSPVETFTLVYREGDQDDLRYSAQCAALFGSRHHELRPRMKSPIAALSEAAEFFDEPIANSTSLALFEMARETARFVKVVLSGDGGDEIFGGYGWHESSLAYDRSRARLRYLLPSFALLHNVVVRPAAHLPFGARAADVGKLLANDPVDRYFRIRGLMDRTERKRFFTRPVSDDPAWVFRKFYERDYPPVHRLLALDLMTFLPDNNLAIMDRAAMAHGLEVRVPLLDRMLVEFAFGLPESCLIQPGQTKILFRRAIEDLLPREVLERPKWGFSPPFKGWLRGPERETIFRMIEKGSLAADGIIRPGAIRKFVERSHPHRYSKLWAVLTLEVWYRRWIADRASDLAPLIAPSRLPESRTRAAE